VLRTDVQALVITSPDRHGGDPLGWSAVAADLAERGYAVLVIAGEAAARAVAETATPADVSRTSTASPAESAEREGVAA